MEGENISADPLLVVGGPTAGGKSALCVKLARVFGGEVVNIDSVQVYREADIGSAKITTDDMEGVPHHLLGIKGPEEQINAAVFSALAESAVADICGRERMPILAAGTTLYLKSFLYGLADAPGGDESVRAELEQVPREILHSKLQEIDAGYAEGISENDTVRIIRGLEIHRLTGKPPSDVFKEHGFLKEKHRALIIVLCWPRGILYDRINARAGQMLEAGLLKEAKCIYERYGRECPIFRTIGYAQCLRAVEGSLPVCELSEEIARATRRFAKRQMTFWRNQPCVLGWKIRPGLDEDGLLLEDNSVMEKNRRHSTNFRVLSLTFSELVCNLRRRLEQDFSKSELWYVDAKRLWR